MEMLLMFLTVMAYFGAAVGVSMIWMHIYQDHQLNHTAAGELRQTMANIKGKQLVIKPIGRYVVVLVISGAWLIATYSV